MTNRRNRIPAAAIALGIAASAAFGLSACGGKSQRWCELDRGDVLVENWHCEQNQAGYEWEPDHDKPKVKKKPNKTKKH